MLLTPPGLKESIDIQILWYNNLCNQPQERVLFVNKINQMQIIFLIQSVHLMQQKVKIIIYHK